MDEISIPIWVVGIGVLTYLGNLIMLYLLARSYSDLEIRYKERE